MRYIHDFLRQRLLRALGMAEQHYGRSVRDYVDAQWSERFEELRLMRMATSFFRYGVSVSREIVVDGKVVRRDDRPTYDHIGYAMAEMKAYLDDGDQEHLLDAANLLMLEFVRPCCHSAPTLGSSDHGAPTYAPKE